MHMMVVVSEAGEDGDIERVYEWYVMLKKRGVRVRFCVRFQAVTLSILGGFPIGNPTQKAIS